MFHHTTGTNDELEDGEEDMKLHFDSAKSWAAEATKRVRQRHSAVSPSPRLPISPSTAQEDWKKIAPR